MKNKVIVPILILFIILFSVISFYFWYHYFLRLGSDGNLSGLDKGNSIVLKDKNKIYATYEEGIEEPINVEGYKFTIENNGPMDARYDLIFVEVPPIQINDGCTNKTLLKPQELNYQLILNNEVINDGRLDQIENKIIDSRKIDGKGTNDYELKVWLNSSSTDNEGKHYHYKVELKVVS